MLRFAGTTVTPSLRLIFCGRQTTSQKFPAEIVVSDSQFTIGRLKNCKAVLEADQISKNHALIFQKEEAWYIRDQKSLNGIYINQQTIPKEEDRLLVHGDEIIFGPNISTDHVTIGLCKYRVEISDIAHKLFRYHTAAFPPKAESSEGDSDQERVKRLLRAVAEFCALEDELAQPVLNVADYKSKISVDEDNESDKRRKVYPRLLLFKADLDGIPEAQAPQCLSQREWFRFKRAKRLPKPQLQLPDHLKGWLKGAKGKVIREPETGEKVPDEVIRAKDAHDHALQSWMKEEALPEFYSALQDLYSSRGTEKSVTLGIGFLRSKEHKTNHPLIEINLEIQADESTGDFLLVPTDCGPVLWNFSGFPYQSDRNLSAALETFKAKEAKLLGTESDSSVSPFDPKSYRDILDQACLLSSEIQCVESHNQVDVRMALPDEMQIVDTWALYRANPKMPNEVRQDCENLCSQLSSSPQSCPSWAIRLVREVQQDDPIPVCDGSAKTNSPFCGSPYQGLFPLDCNIEQERILKLLQDHSAVLVRGPPGTGKTHTVANIICHFLAKGQRILAISEGSHALRVLWNKLRDAVPQIENLAVPWYASNIEAIEHLEKASPTLTKIGLEGISEQDREENDRAQRDKKILIKKIEQTDSILKLIAELHLLPLKDNINSMESTFETASTILEQRINLVQIISALDSQFLEFSPEELIVHNQLGGENDNSSSQLCFPDILIASCERKKQILEFCSAEITEWDSICRWLEDTFHQINISVLSLHRTRWKHFMIMRFLHGYLSSIERMCPMEEVAGIMAARRDNERRIHQVFLKSEVAIAAKDAVKGHWDQDKSIPNKLQQFIQAIRSSNTARKRKVPQYVAEAKRLLQSKSLIHAVPLWIMCTTKVSDILPSELGDFDLVILDESSQSDICCLPALLRGKRILIIGDEKQVSPPDRAPDFEQRAKAVQTKYLRGLPYNNLECAVPVEGHSIFDLCINAFAGEQTCFLREHFRCLGDIIEFSSKNFYEGNLIAVRQKPRFRCSSSSLIIKEVQNGRRERDINQNEADAIVHEVGLSLLLILTGLVFSLMIFFIE
jgi:hypothetical protein